MPGPFTGTPKALGFFGSVLAATDEGATTAGIWDAMKESALDTAACSGPGQLTARCSSLLPARYLKPPTPSHSGATGASVGSLGVVSELSTVGRRSLRDHDRQLLPTSTMIVEKDKDG